MIILFVLYSFCKTATKRCDMIRKRDFTDERGATMMEIFGVLSVLAILMVGALAGYNKIMEKYRQTKGLADTKQLIKDVNSFCSFERPCRITNEKAYQLDILTPEYYDASSKKAFSPFGSDYTFQWTNGTGAGGDVCTGCAYYSFQHTALPVSSCVELLTADWNEEVYTRLYKFTNGTYSFLFNEQKGYTCAESAGCYYFPMPLDKATEMCSAAWEAFKAGTGGNANGGVDYVFKWYFI